ncbi:unnamed protein product, partial [Rotaria magnacalcarata]
MSASNSQYEQNNSVPQ